MTLKLLTIFLIVAALAAVSLAGLFYISRRWPDGLGRIGRALVIGALVLVLLTPLLFLAQYFAVDGLVSSYIDQIQDVIGINRFLAKALAAIFFIPALLSLRYLFSLSSRRRLIGFGLLTLYAVLTYGFLWQATKDQYFTRAGEPLKCFVVTREGVTFRDRAGTDPATGRRCEWVTAEILPRLKLLESKLRSGQSLVPLDPNRPLQFFSVATGEPIIWYYRTPEGDYEFFDIPGFHPSSGAALKPVNEDVLATWREYRTRRAEEQAKARRLAELERTRRLAEQKEKEKEKEKQDALLREDQQRREAEERQGRERAAAEAKRDAHLRHMRSLLNPTASKPDQTLALAIRPGQNISDREVLEFTRSLRSSANSRLRLDSNLFKNQFFIEGYFDKVFNGDITPLTESQAFERAAFIMVGAQSAQCGDNPVASNMKSCTIVLDYRIYARAGQPIARGRIQRVGAGFTPEQAKLNAATLLAEERGEALLSAVVREMKNESR